MIGVPLLAVRFEIGTVSGVRASEEAPPGLRLACVSDVTRAPKLNLASPSADRGSRSSAAHGSVSWRRSMSLTDTRRIWAQRQVRWHRKRQSLSSKSYRLNAFEGATAQHLNFFTKVKFRPSILPLPIQSRLPDQNQVIPRRTSQPKKRHSC